MPLPLLLCLLLASSGLPNAEGRRGPDPAMYYSDTSRTGLPFAKDPSVIVFHHASFTT